MARNRAPPEVISVTTEYVRRFFKEHPDYDAFSISLNDGRGFCECDRCRRLDSGAITNAAADPESGQAGRMPVITDRILTFTNQVAAGLAPTNPDKKLILFAYGPYKQPSTGVRPAANVIIQYTFHSVSNWNPEVEEQQLRETGAWSDLTKQLAVYEYFTQGNCPDLPRLMPEPIQRSVQRLRAQGFLYYQTQSGDGHAINGLNNYILARLLWNPSADVKAIQADDVEKGFGTAAGPMTRYFGRIEERWKQLRGKPVDMDAAAVAQYRTVAEAYPPQFRAACREDLAEAARLAEGQDRERVRIAQTKLAVCRPDAERGREDAAAAGGGLEIQPGCRGAARRCQGPDPRRAEAWEERDRHVESHKQDFALSYVWIRYNDQNRSCVPLRKMREFEAGSPPPVPKLTPKQESEWRSQIKAELFVPDPLPALAPRTHGRFEPAEGVIAEGVSYATEFGMRLPAILYLPKTRTGKIPAMVVVNGHGGDKYTWYSFYAGILYARGGRTVLTYDPAGEGGRNIKRKSETRAHDKVQPPDELPRYLGGLMMTDLMQAVSYLSQRPEIDARRIDATGYSLGPFVVTLTCAVDTRLHACVPVGGRKSGRSRRVLGQYQADVYARSLPVADLPRGSWGGNLCAARGMRAHAGVQRHGRYRSRDPHTRGGFPARSAAARGRAARELHRSLRDRIRAGCQPSAILRDTPGCAVARAQPRFSALDRSGHSGDARDPYQRMGARRRGRDGSDVRHRRSGRRDAGAGHRHTGIVTEEPDRFQRGRVAKPQERADLRENGSRAARAKIQRAAAAR